MTELRDPPASQGRGLAAVVLALSIILTLLTSWLAHQAVRRSAQRTFDAEVAQIETGIRDRFEAYLQVLRGGAALFDSSDFVSAEEFAVYVGRMRLSDHFPGIQGVGWSVRIENNDLAKHERETRALASRQPTPQLQELYRRYAVYSVGDLTEQPFRTSIVYLEPFDDRNQQAFGLDMFGEQIRNKAMREAAASGEPALSRRVTLVQEIDSDVQPGFLVYHPVYAGRPTTREERLNALLGFVYSPFRARDLMTGILGAPSPSVGFEIYDGSNIGLDALLYGGDGEQTPHFEDGARQPTFTHIERLDIAGHTWTIFFGSSARFDAENGHMIAGSVFAIGLLISFLLTWIVRSLASARERAVALARALEVANDMTRDLRASESHAQNLAQELARSNEDLKNFAHVASHDLQAPLRQITSFMELLKLEYGDKLDEQANVYIDYASRSGKRLGNLVKDLLEYSRAGGQKRPKDVISSEDALHRALENLQLEIEESQAQIESGELPEVHANLDLMVSVFQNILSNAIKYCERQPRIRIEAGLHEGNWVFAIQDNGIGIKPDCIDGIFTMFNRLHSGDQYEGSGIGLATCKKIIDDAGGWIKVESEPSKGTKFSIGIPAVPVHDLDPKDSDTMRPNPVPAVAAGN